MPPPDFSIAVPAAPVAATGARAGARVLAADVGIALFYAYMLMPARLQETISVVTLDIPEMAVAYGVGYPYFTVLDAIMLAWGLAAWAIFSGRRQGISMAMLAYVGVSLAAAGIAYYRFAAGIEEAVFWDGVLGAVRLLAAYAVFAALPSSEARWGRRLQDALAVLFVMSLLLNLAGFQNRSTFSNEAGRLTASGFDFATTSYFGVALILTAITISHGRRRQLLIAIGLIGVAMGGGRIAAAMAALTLGVMMLQGRPRTARLAVKLALGGVVLAVIVVAIVPELLERIPTLRRQQDDAAYYQNPPQLSPEALNYFPFLRSWGLNEPAVIGRFNTWAAAIQLVQERKWQPAGSDWRVQQGLALHGVPSHSHHAYLQSAIKFGPLAALVWLPLFASAWRGMRGRSPYGPVLFMLLVSLMFDYWLLVAKALFLLYAFAALNDAWLAQHARRRRRVGTPATSGDRLIEDNQS